MHRGFVPTPFSTLPSVGTLVGGWEVEGVSLSAVASLLLDVVLAMVVVVNGYRYVVSMMSHNLSLVWKMRQSVSAVSVVFK